MRRRAVFAVWLILALSLTGCARNMTEKDEIISLFREHESVFLASVERGDFSAVEKIGGVREVSLRGDEGEIEFYCGGRGLVPSSSYYGILYIKGAADTDYAQVLGAGSEWSADGARYRFRQADGDTDFYYEALGNGFYYYEEHF